MDKQFVNRFLKGTFSASTGTIATVGFHFLSITLLTRVVTPDVLGLYFLIIATTALLKILGSLGLDLTLVKFLSNEDELERKETVSVILMTRFLLLAVFSLILFLFSDRILPLLGEGLDAYAIFIPLIFAGHSVRELFLYLLQGLHQFKHYALVQAISAIVKFSLILLLMQRMDLVLLLTIEVIMLAASILLQIRIIPFRRLGLFNGQFNRKTLRQVMTFGLPLYYTSIMVAGYGRSSVFLINYFLDPLSIAFFEIAVKIPEGVVRILRSFITVYFPNLSTLFSQNKKQEAMQLINKSIGIGSLGIATMVVGSYLFRDEIVQLVFSEQYGTVGVAFALAMVNVFLGSISNIMGYALVSAGHPRTSSVVNTISVVVYLFSSVLLIPRAGYLGAIIAFLLMNIAAIAANYGFMVRTQMAPNMVKFLQPTGLGAAVCVVFMMSGFSGIWTKGAFLLAFIGLCALLIADFRETLRYVRVLAAALKRRFVRQVKPV